MALNPQQLAFKEYYSNPQSETFGNAMQSALAAGYTQEYAENITSLSPKWLSEIIGDANRLQKADEVLDEVLGMDHQGDVGKMKVKTDVAKFVAKKKYDVSRQQIEHNVQQHVEITVTHEQAKEIAQRYEAELREVHAREITSEEE